MAQETTSIKISSSDFNKYKNKFLSMGFNEDAVPAYCLWKLKSNDSVVLLYQSGKLVIQSSNIEKINKSLSDENTQNYVTSVFKPHIGMDEVGKGDYFGPLVLCATFLTENNYKELKKKKIIDSKKLTDLEISNKGEYLSENVIYECIVIHPDEYNKLHEEYGNVAIILAKKYVELVKKILSSIKQSNVVKPDYILLDQFSNSKSRVGDLMKNQTDGIEFRQNHHGEEDVSVAAASIIARYVFLKEWESMCQKYKFDFPKGATHVIEKGKEFVSMKGKEELENVAKVSFVTTKKILSL